MWIKHPTFRDVVHQNWSLSFEGYGMYALAGKLKRLKKCLQAWNKTTFGNVFDRVAQAEELAHQKEQRMEQENTEASHLEWSQAQANFLQALANEEFFWKQKARIKWLQEGDSNTKFFHSYVQDKRARLRISRIKSSMGDWIEDLDAIAAEGVSFFQKLLSRDHIGLAKALAEERATQQLLLNISSLVISQQNVDLIRMVTMGEVKEAVFGLDGDSAAGADGFSGVGWLLGQEGIWLSSSLYHPDLK
ncbi:uncharacterized protein [Coffea arabica]|uniref:Uncharacterized protein n=1 Tax=Coffea arabica TaxID=13443 RepID=A0ABM4WP08_COFAR